ncbi:hypothetical protein RMHFA_05637 (plasmid) [Roseomonas mucosa]|nr:hypothetical protein RMHFA_05637 [Roseomonas mucosa]
MQGDERVQIRPLHLSLLVQHPQFLGRGSQPCFDRIGRRLWLGSEERAVREMRQPEQEGGHRQSSDGWSLAQSATAGSDGTRTGGVCGW